MCVTDGMWQSCGRRKRADGGGGSAYKIKIKNLIQNYVKLQKITELNLDH